MQANRNTARIVGVLFIVQMAAAIISYSVILEPILHKANFPLELAPNSSVVLLAMLLDLIVGVSVVTIAIMLFPILKKYNERIALWYIGQRLIELISFMITGILLITMLKIGQDLSSGPAVEATYLEAIARYLRGTRGSLQDINLLIYCLGAWPFYGLLYYAKLVPRFISVWGFLAVTLLFIEILANIYGTTVGGMLIMMPLGLNEIFLGFWLIVQGFSRPLTS